MLAVVPETPPHIDRESECPGAPVKKRTRTRLSRTSDFDLSPMRLNFDDAGSESDYQLTEPVYESSPGPNLEWRLAGPNSETEEEWMLEATPEPIAPAAQKQEQTDTMFQSPPPKKRAASPVIFQSPKEQAPASPVMFQSLPKEQLPASQDMFLSPPRKKRAPASQEMFLSPMIKGFQSMSISRPHLKPQQECTLTPVKSVAKVGSASWRKAMAYDTTPAKAMSLQTPAKAMLAPSAKAILFETPAKAIAMSFDTPSKAVPFQGF